MVLRSVQRLWLNNYKHKPLQLLMLQEQFHRGHKPFLAPDPSVLEGIQTLQLFLDIKDSNCSK